MEGPDPIRGRQDQVPHDGAYPRLLTSEFHPTRRNPAHARFIQLTTDHALMTDKIFKPVAQLYAKDEGKFFEDF